jgi:cell wall-associated NlpC family hydrolase
MLTLAAALICKPTPIDGMALAAESEPATDVVNDPGRQVADFAATLVGTPYRTAGLSPLTGFDCSGLVYYTYRQFGVTLSRDAASQFGNGQPVGKADLEPGDIVFFREGGRISHDGIYIGNGRFVHAVSHAMGVRISLLDDAYWVPIYAGARRILA